MRRLGLFTISILLSLCALMLNSADSAIIDTYYEDFDDRQDDATIDGVDQWSVTQGSTSSAITQDSTTYEGMGKTLELVGAETAVNVSNAKSFTQISPTWIEFIVKPGMGAQTRTVPSSTIAAITFDHKGKIYASDGSSWVETGESFTSDDWYRVTMKLDFSTHTYDLYISPVVAPEIAFIPDKEDLQFVDTSINLISQLGFGGVYHATETDDNTYIDNLIIHFVDRLQVTTTSYTVTENKASGPITVQLQNALSEPQTAWQDFTLELRSTSSTGEFSVNKDEWVPMSQIVIPEDSQSITFYYKDSKGGKPIITASEYPDRGWWDAIQQQEIVSEVAHFEVAVKTPQIAGRYFGLQITAKDEDGSINETYDGEVEITLKYVSPKSGTMMIAPQTASGFNGGILELNAVYPDCGLVQIAISDKEDISRTGSSGEILFLPASFGVVCETPQVTGKGFPLTVTAYNAEEQKKTTPNYKGPAVVEVVPISPESLSGGTLTPSRLETQDFVDGIAGPDTIYDRWGIVKIKAYDEGYPGQAGVSGDIDFRPAGVRIEVKRPSAEREFFYIGEKIEIAISAVDGTGNPIPNYLGTLTIGSSVGLSMPPTYQFVELDKGKHTFVSSANTSGTYFVKAEETKTGLATQSPDIIVKDATLVVIDSESPVGMTEIRIQLVDENNNVITSENDLTLTIELEEENSNSSASSDASLVPVTFKDGIASIIVSDTEAESVTISPKSEYKFKVKKGTVKFGKIAKTGIGVLMWREIRK